MTAATRVITVRRDIQEPARLVAAEFREAMARAGTLVVNVIASPGAGKTTLLGATARHFAGRHKVAILVGDIATDRDAQRLAEECPAAQLTTGGACHLDLPLVERGLRALNPGQVDFLFIENVGNLVCPASHDLGEHLRVIVLSVPEGDDKPAKYPKAFRTSHALIVSKIDLLPYVPFSVDAASRDALAIQPELSLLTVAALNGVGIDAWCRFLETRRDALIASGRPNLEPQRV